MTPRQMNCAVTDFSQEIIPTTHAGHNPYTLRPIDNEHARVKVFRNAIENVAAT